MKHDIAPESVYRYIIIILKYPRYFESRGWKAYSNKQLEWSCPDHTQNSHDELLICVIKK